jgi:DHA2 family multidrug resistance protein
MQPPQPPLFKAWAPEWLIRGALFAVLLPSYMLLGLYAGSGTAAAGYYGIEPADVQFSILVYYAGLVAFFPFDPRISSYLVSRQQLAISISLLFLLTWLASVVRELHLFLVIRFLQGVVGATVGSPCLTLIFSRLDTKRARAFGYSVFYGALLASGPFTTALITLVLDNYDFPAVFHFYILMQLPGALLLLAMLHSVRLKRRIPLYQLEWPSFVLFAATLVLLGYLAAYGQQQYWLEDPTMRLALGLSLALGALFVLRQRGLKRPYLNLSVLGYRNFRLGLWLFFLFYLARGTTGIASAYFSSVLRFDAWHIAALQVPTLVGIALGMSIVVRFVLLEYPLRPIWLVGFGCLLAYHVWMYFLFGPGQGAEDFVLPLFVQGLGVGALMVPITVFTLSALPPTISQAGSYTAVTTRYLGFIASITLVNFFQLYWRTDSLNRLAQEVLPGTSQLSTRLQGYQQTLVSKGMALQSAQRVATRLLENSLETQSQMRYAMSYYGMMSVGLLVLLLALIILPPVHQKLVSFRQRPL